MKDDREPLPPGPWDDEPDYKSWTDESTGLPCLIVRNRFGTLCGYVGVTKGHIFYERSYSSYRESDPERGESPEDRIEVHGGLTYSGECQVNVCHEPELGASHDVWWFGFDCGHAWDISPFMIKLDAEHGFPPTPGQTYRDIAFVEGECAGLAKQLKEME